MIEPVLLGLLDRRGCDGELLIVGLNRPQNFWVYLVFNGLGCSPDGIFDRNRRTRSMSNDTDAIYKDATSLPRMSSSPKDINAAEGLF